MLLNVFGTLLRFKKQQVMQAFIQTTIIIGGTSSVITYLILKYLVRVCWQ